MSLTFTVVCLFAKSLSHILAIIRQHFCYWGDHCTVHFVYCALRHIVVLLLVSFVEYIHCIFWRPSQSFMSFTLLCMFLVHKHF
jgi:hypothetical protein